MEMKVCIDCQIKEGFSSQTFDHQVGASPPPWDTAGLQVLICANKGSDPYSIRQKAATAQTWEMLFQDGAALSI